MPRRNITGQIAFLVLALLVGCSRDSEEIKRLNGEIAKLKDEARQQQLAKEAAALQATTIEGSVFIATRGGEVLKLALVPIVAVDPEAYAEEVKKEKESILAKVNEALAEMKETANREATLRAEYQKQLSRYNDTVSEYNIAGEELLKVASVSRRERTITLNSNAGPLAKDRAAAFNVARKRLFDVGSALNAAYADLGECYKVDTKQGMQYAGTLVLASSQIVPLDAVAAIAKSKTDADGRFTIAVKRPANVVLMAHTEREAPDGTESYWWYVPVLGKPEDDSIKVMLSNDNLVSHLALLTPDEMGNPEKPDRTPVPAPPAVEDNGAPYGIETEAENVAPIAAVPHESSLPLDASVLDVAPIPVREAPPVYPFQMRRAGLSGEVLVDFIIDNNGDVENAFAAHSTMKGFEAAAVECVSKWKFRPGRKNGQVCFTHMVVPIVFTLSADN